MKRVKLSKEPVLKIHGWIVAINLGKNERYFYCKDKKEVQCRRDQAPKGAIVYVFRAVHNFREAWMK